MLLKDKKKSLSKQIEVPVFLGIFISIHSKAYWVWMDNIKKIFKAWRPIKKVELNTLQVWYEYRSNMILL